MDSARSTAPRPPVEAVKPHQERAANLRMLRMTRMLCSQVHAQVYASSGRHPTRRDPWPDERPSTRSTPIPSSAVCAASGDEPDRDGPCSRHLRQLRQPDRTGTATAHRERPPPDREGLRGRRGVLLRGRRGPSRRRPARGPGRRGVRGGRPGGRGDHRSGPGPPGGGPRAGGPAPALPRDRRTGRRPRLTGIGPDAPAPGRAARRGTRLLLRPPQPLRPPRHGGRTHRGGPGAAPGTGRRPLTTVLAERHGVHVVQAAPGRAADARRYDPDTGLLFLSPGSATVSGPSSSPPSSPFWSSAR